MSIRKINSTLSSQINWRTSLSGIKGAFLTTKNYTLTDADLVDKDAMFADFSNNNILPLHFVQETNKKNEDTFYNESLHDFSYKLREGRYRQSLRYDWSLSFYQFMKQYDGMDLNIIYYFNDGKLLLYDNNDGTYRGIKTNRIILEKIDALHNYSDYTFTDLDIELKDVKELSDGNATLKSIDWMPELVDTLFIHLNVLYIDNTQLNFEAKHYGEDITDLGSGDITLIDDVNSTIESFTLNFGAGQYSITGLSEDISYGALIVQSNMYYGCTKYRYIATTSSIIGFNLLDDDVFYLLSDEAFNLLEN